MSNPPLVSVILPSYNHVDFVREVVESVLNQSFQNLELIIVDDGSTDGTPEQIEKIKDHRIQLIRLETNRMQHPRNLALGLAKGRYIAFQNSDDVWLPDKLSTQVEFINKHDDVLVSFTGVELIDDNNEILTSSWANGLFTIENRTNIAWLRHFFTHGNCLCISSALARRQAINDVGNFRGSLIQVSDFDLWIRLAAIGNLHILDENLTLMRIVAGEEQPRAAPKEDVIPPQDTVALSYTTSSGFRTASRIADWVLPVRIKAIIKASMGIRDLPEEIEKIEEIIEPEIHITSSANLSAPSPNAANRSVLEFADVLGNFVEPPILDILPQIFEDIIPDFKHSEYILQAWLATHAWSTNSPHHHLFADRVIASILENDLARKEVVNIFGAEIVKSFIQKRGQIEVHVTENEIE